MAFVVQNDAGDVASANAYDSVANFKAYHTDRGNNYSSYMDAAIEQAIVRATDYVDTRWDFIGVKLNGTAQTTEWPRKSSGQLYTSLTIDSYLFLGNTFFPSETTSAALFDREGNEITGIPAAIKEAMYEVAFRALSIPLYQDMPAPSGGRVVKRKSVVVGPIRTDVEYEGGAPQIQLPVYPLVEFIILRAGLVQSRGLMR